MELSLEAPDDGFRPFRRQKIDTSTSCQLTEDNDIIDSTELTFSNDENWLRECSSKSSTDLRSWLYDLPPSSDDNLPTSNVKSNPKNIDTRTFTRPKKRFTRPSIEKYNEELYGNELKELTDSGIQLNGCTQDDSPPPQKPLHFDLGGQTSSSVYFENMIANAPMMDSFTNMSPPSLVNSMCSSTFANLMENSFIKNDPVLREIRDTDFTGSILQQEVEPMFHSISESYSSLNSDVPENFLKKVSFTEHDDDLKVQQEEEEGEFDRTIIVARNETFVNQEDGTCNRTITLDDDFQDAKATNHVDLNSTYQRSTKLETPLNSTFQRRKSPKISQDINSTMTLEPERNDRTFENVKRLLDRRPSPSLDLNRLSYVIDKNDQLNATFTTESPKRNSFGSTDSGENLDYMSLSSSSTNSKSSKMQSIDELNAIIENSNTFIRKLPDLHQVMSTPKPKNKTPVLWPNHEISPINDRNSDPELSSTEQKNAVIVQNTIRKQRSVGHINQRIANPRNTQSTQNAIRGSHPNLKMTEPKTYGLQRQSNLNSMGHTLKGSYTSLKPMNTNLPVAPPPLDTTITVKTPAVAQVFPVPREVSKTQDAQFVKPQPPRSNLPRPVTGIPRPVSRIPGPRSIRPVSKSAGLQGRH